MSAAQSNYPSSVQQILNNCRRQILVHTVLVGVATIATVAVAYVICAGLLDYLIGLPSGIRAAIFSSFVAVLLGVIWRSLIRPLREKLPAEQLGAAVDLSTPELQESLATLISIERPDATAGESGSPMMRRYLRKQVGEHLAGVTGSRVVDTRKTVQKCGIAGFVMMMGVLPFVVWPSGSGLLFERMVSPFSNLATASHLYFDVVDGNRVVARGSNVEVAGIPMWRSETPGERPDVVDLRLIGQNGDTDTLPMMFDPVGNRFLTELPRIAESVRYQIVGGGATTQTFELTVVDAPEIHTAVMTAISPAYAGRAVQRFDGMVGDMDVFERSELEILLEFNKPITSAALVWAQRDARPVTEAEMLEIEFDDLSGEEVMELDHDAPSMAIVDTLETSVDGNVSADGRAAVFHIMADVGGDFAFEIKDEDNLRNVDEPDRHLTVTFDMPPQLDVSGIHNVDEFRPDDILPVNCLAVDDIGIGDVSLHYRINDDVEKIVVAADFDRGVTEVRQPFRLQLDELSLTSGDVLKVRIRAVDERPLPTPQETWSQTYTIGIDDNAKAAGQRAMEEETQQMVDALKQLEELLKSDINTAADLKEKTRKGWTEQNRDETQRLSEKEQQQGQILEKLAEDVATHPLMQESSAALQELSQDLRQQLPKTLDQAVDADRRGASDKLKQAGQQLQDALESLHSEIEKIEEVANLEQDLAELNRLALEAEQLAQDANQLEQDRVDDENRPDDIDDQDWNQQLDQRQRELMQDQAQLSDELGQLIQERQELLESAQQAQREQLMELSDVAKKLAERQQQLADGVEDEAKDAAQDAKQLARQLQKAIADAKQLNKDLPDQNGVEPADIQKLNDAAEQLKQGNLAAPDQPLREVAAGLNQNDEQLRAAQKEDETVAEVKQRESSAERSTELAERLEDIRKRAAELRDERLEEPPKPDEAVDPQNPMAAEKSVQETLDNLRSLADEAEQMAADVQQNAETTQSAQQSANKAAQDARQSSAQAESGQFSDAANEAQKASSAAQQAGKQMNTAAQEETRHESQKLSEDLNKMSQQLRAMQQNDAAQVAAQQGAQQDIAEQAASLPEQLQDLSERLNLEALQMAEQAEQAESAMQSANQAQQSSQQASSELQDGNLQSAGEAGDNTAEELQRLAQQTQQAGQSPGEQPSSPVPTEVGESVADALQDLNQAAQAMQQNSEQQGSGEAGESAEQGGEGQSPGSQGEPSASGQPGENGQPGEGGQKPGPGQQPGQPGQNGQPGQGGQPSGSQQLSAAAKALAQAAQGALPGQFNPGQMSEGGESQAAGNGAKGNDGLWNGLVPNKSDGPENTRDWGGLTEELETETSDGLAVSRDSEYEALIRMYFREVAKAASQD